MVFNVHLLQHLPDCVRLIGPLFAYSNYCFEDNIGHLVELHKGTTDVASQISEKYILEKNLIQYLNISPISKQFYEHISGKKRFINYRNVAGSLLIGRPKEFSSLPEHEKCLISNTINISKDTQILKYGAILLNNKTFYESIGNSEKRTNDSIIFNMNSQQFACIESIFLINEIIFIMINEKYEIRFDGSNTCKSNVPLKELIMNRRKILDSKFIGPKFALINFDNSITCSKFPNMYEGN